MSLIGGLLAAVGDVPASDAASVGTTEDAHDWCAVARTTTNDVPLPGMHAGWRGGGREGGRGTEGGGECTWGDEGACRCMSNGQAWLAGA